MARLQDVRLNAAGRRRSAVFTLTGTIVWDGSDGSRNGGELLVRFLGRDPGEDDLIWNTFQWVAKGGDSRAVDGPGTWTITADGPSRSRFEVRVENTNGPFRRRPFNEDTPGRD